MPVTLPVDTYEILEKKLGREDAKILIKTLETTISDTTDYKWKVTKEELLEAIRKEFVTKELFEEKLQSLKELFEERMKAFEEKLQSLKELFEEKLRLELQTLKAELTTRFTVMFLILLFTIIFLNQNALEFIAKVIGLVK